ncbi:hypothetical protein AZ46_0210085 [Metabacillus indicus LMG 22858]|nr:hypothetical protein AZ46_0210085 [Metabacillus indicus LMG 22858]
MGACTRSLSLQSLAFRGERLEPPRFACGVSSALFIPRKAEAPVLLRQSDKKSPEKSAFDFLGDFVLTEELGAAAGQGVKCLPLQFTGVYIFHILRF